MSVASPRTQWRVVPCIPCGACGRITSQMLFWHIFNSPSTSSYNQRRVVFFHYKCTSSASSSLFVVISSFPFLTNKDMYDLIFCQIKVSNHPCPSSSVLDDTVLTVSPRSSYCFYSVFTSMWHSPLLNTAGHCNLSVMILTCVVTTNRLWTFPSTRTKICKHSCKPCAINTK